MICLRSATVGLRGTWQLTPAVGSAATCAVKNSGMARMAPAICLKLVMVGLVLFVNEVVMAEGMRA